jgi:hypothetical protein
MNDRDGNRSNPYKPDPAMCCEACVFGRGEHAEWCGRRRRRETRSADRDWLVTHRDGSVDLYVRMTPEMLAAEFDWHCELCEPKPRSLNADAASSYALSFVTHA